MAKKMVQAVAPAVEVDDLPVYYAQFAHVSYSDFDAALTFFQRRPTAALTEGVMPSQAIPMARVFMPHKTLKQLHEAIGRILESETDGDGDG